MLPALTPALLAFIAQHRRSSLDDLLLRTPAMPGVSMAFVAQQVQARRDLQAKLPGWVANDQLLFPPRVAQEQASSEATAQFKAAAIQRYLEFTQQPHRCFADITCGFAVDAVALARHFHEGVLCERDADLAALGAFNVAALGLSHQLRVLAVDAATWLTAQPDDSFDLIYLDPARRDTAARRVSALADCTPDVLTLLPLLLRKSAVVLLKAAPMLDIDLACRQLVSATAAIHKEQAHVAEVHVVASAGDCKELLFILQRGRPSTSMSAAEPKIIATELPNDAGHTRFAFTRSEEQGAAATIGVPEAYLYVPNPALLKAGAFRLVGQRYGLRKLHVHTHLYTSSNLCGDFPGRTFAIEGRAAASRRGARELFPEGQAGLLARNAGAAVDVLRTRLGLRDGGPLWAVACTLADGRCALLRARRVSGETAR